MSRSYKKYPIFTQQAHKSDKRAANKRIRKFLKSIEQGFKTNGFIHKLFNQWDIRDWRFIPKTIEDIQKAKRK